MRIISLLGALWGITGVVVFIFFGIYRLAPIAWDTFNYPLTWYHYLALVFSIVFMAHSEGYRGFQCSFSPRVAARTKFLSTSRNILLLLLAPLFCMGYFYASKKTKIVSICLTIGIIILILLLRLVPQPWRGICDCGVVVGLSWGIISLVVFVFLAFFSSKFNHSPDLGIVSR